MEILCALSVFVGLLVILACVMLAVDGRTERKALAAANLGLRRDLAAQGHALAIQGAQLERLRATFDVLVALPPAPAPVVDEEPHTTPSASSPVTLTKVQRYERSLRDLRAILATRPDDQGLRDLERHWIGLVEREREAERGAEEDWHRRLDRWVEEDRRTEARKRGDHLVEVERPAPPSAPRLTPTEPSAVSPPPSAK